MNATKERKNIKFGIILSYINLFVSILGSFFISNRVLNYIGDYNFGLYSFVNSITVWLTVVSAALNSSFVRFSTVEESENEGDSSRINTLYLKIFILMGTLILVIGLSIIGVLYFNDVRFGSYDLEDSKFMYILFALSIVNISLTIPSTLFTLYVSFKKRFIFGKIVVIWNSIFTFAGHFLIAYLTRNIIYIAAFTILATLIDWILNFVFCKKVLKISFAKATFKDNKHLLKQIAVFSGILVFNAIVDQINMSVDKTLLGFFSVPEDVTIYHFGQQFDTYLISMSIAISSVFTPSIHELVVKNDEESINRLYLKISKSQTLVICLITFGFISCGYDFVVFWLGQARINVYFVALILMAIDICPLTLNSSIEIQRAKNKHLFRAIVYFAVALLNIGLSILFLFIFPDDKKIFACLLGSVIARILSHWISMNIYNKKCIGLPVGKYLINMLIYIIFSSVAAGAAIALKLLVLDSYITSSVLKCLIEGALFVALFAGELLIFDRKYIVGFLRRKANA